MKRMSTGAALVAAPLFLSLSPASNAAMLIDGFDVGSFSFANPQVNTSVAPTGDGYTRTLNVAAGTMPGGVNPTGGILDIDSNVPATPSISRYSHAQDSGAYGVSNLTYGLGGLNLLDEANAFRFSYDLLAFNAFFNMLVDGVQVSLSTTTIRLANGGLSETTGFVDFLFADFIGADFSNVSSMSFVLDGNNANGFDAIIDDISTVCSSLLTSGGSGNSAGGNLATDCAPAAVSSSWLLPLMATGLLGVAGLRLRRRV